MSRTATTAILAAGLLTIVASLAHAENQTILGSSFQVKNPSTPEKRKIAFKAKEKFSSNTIVGDPVADGARIGVTATGGTTTGQIFVLPKGLSPTTGKSFWSGDAVKGYKYKDSKGENGPVKAVSMKAKNGTFQLVVTIDGKLGSIDVVPPDPGTRACSWLGIGEFGFPGDYYFVEFGDGTVTNKGATDFKVNTPTVEGNCCGHSPCEEGGPLAPCDSCLENVCDLQPSCCTVAWDSSCITLAFFGCGIC